MPYGLTTNGFVIKRLADIKTELETAFKSEFGDAINLQPQAPIGQIIGIFSERLSLLWELAEGVYNSFDPASATGTSLDRICAVVGVVRQQATKSTVTVTCTGTAATVIPMGTVFSVAGDEDARFVSIAEVTIAGGGTIANPCEAETAGAVEAPTGTLTVIETPITGLTSITNASDAVVGEDEETDAALRFRRNLELQQSDAGTLEAIRVALTEVEDVTRVAAFENVTDADDGDGRPPHSFEMVVQNGTDQDIGDAIWEKKPAGIQSYGTEDVDVVDSMGVTQTVYFSRPSEVDIYVIVNVVREEATALPTEAQVKAKVLEYGDTLNMGDDVLPTAGMIPVIMGLSNIREIEVLVKITAPPTAPDPIVLDPNEIATFDTANITVNFS
jgi:uncharacterized phage protein gp47/JayE